MQVGVGDVPEDAEMSQCGEGGKQGIGTSVGDAVEAEAVHGMRWETTTQWGS